MQAERLTLETDQSGNLINLPKLPANEQFEAIFLLLENTSTEKKQLPHPDIVKKLKITGDIIDTIPEID